MKSAQAVSSVLLALMFSAVGSASLHGAVLVQSGRPAAVIVTPSSVDPSAPVTAKRARKKPAADEQTAEGAAASVLREWIKKMTDVELPVVTVAPAEGTTAVYVGRAAMAAGLKLDDITSPSREGLRIAVEERRVLLAGQTEAATLKAVCRFLEEMGCRNFMEGAMGEEYPRTNTLSISARVITEQPGLLGRNPKGPSWRPSLWKSWNGAGGEVFHHQHAWGGYVRESLFREHPEFFAMGADGRRKQGQWLCTSNPGLRQYFADQVLAAIRGGTKNPSLSPTDGRGYCQCPNCQAQDDPNSIEPSSGVVSISNRYTDFFDDIARRVAVVYPDSVLSFYCYADYTQPPTFKRQLSPNLCAVIAPIRYCRLHEIGHAGCPSREQQVAMTEGWAKVASRLGYYNYLYNLADATLPFFKFTACEKEFPYLKSKGLDYMTIEVLSNWHIYGPQIYLSLRLAYNPQANAEAIMEDYWQRFYGPQAAPFMKQYWMGIDQAQSRLGSHAGGFFGLAQIYTPAFMGQCAAQLEKARLAAAGTARHAERVALHTEGFKSAQEYQRLGEAMQHGDFQTAQSLFTAMLERLTALSRQGWANPEYGTAYLKRFLGKIIAEGAQATAPPNRLALVLPESWRLAFDDEGKGLERGYAAANFDDAKWPLVFTSTKTLDAQGFDKNTILWYRASFESPNRTDKPSLFFTEVDGFTEVFVNGRKVPIPEAATKPGKAGPDGQPVTDRRAKPRAPFQVDISSMLQPGRNTVALRVDHTKITELALGGILRPVLLVERRK